VPAHTLHLQPRRAIRGALSVPGDKSISHRYLMLGAIARGRTTIVGLSPGADVAATADCFRALGTVVVTAPEVTTVDGDGRPGLRAPAAALDAVNSGTTMRLAAGILAGCPFRSVMTGDASLRRRPMRRVIDPLSAMGARIASDNGRAPLVIDGGPLAPIDWTTPVPSAQIKSAIMLAGLAASGTTTVREALRTRDHTERAFPAFGLAVERDDNSVRVSGPQDAVAPGRPLRVPGDPSSAAVWAAAAAALPGSIVELRGVGLNPGRIGFLAALERLGARVTVRSEEESGGEPIGTIIVEHQGHGEAVIGAGEVPGLIDELPVLAARAALGARLEVSGASELRVKESDRITALVTGFRALGVSADERPDGFVVDGTRRPGGGQADAASDHRLVMAFALVALGASGPTTITGADVVAVSYPGFAADLDRISA
jgi:3-phosphoshikimate 1-carboxyvinyltransferase